MTSKKAACGAALSAALVATLGVAGVGYAADYQPTVLGNDAYSNHVDERNDYTVTAITYTAPIADQNTETVAETQALAVTMGQAGEDSTPIKVTNSLGTQITGLAFRTSAEASFPSNMLSGSLADGESACWNFTYAYEEQEFTNTVGHDYAMPVNYTLQATLADGTTAEFHDINLNGVRTLNLCWSEEYGVHYVERTTVTNHTPDPNLYYEANLVAEADAETFNYHVNSSAAMGARQVTESRGGGWESTDHTSSQAIEDFGIEILLYGTSQGDYTDGVYDELRWNSDSLTWRDYNNE